MKKLTHLFILFIGVLVAAMLVLPAAAQRSRANNDPNKQHGKERAEQVQLDNKKGTVAPGVENAENKDKKNNGKHKHKGWSKKAKHNAKGPNK